jgi:hypothetical protein
MQRVLVSFTRGLFIVVVAVSLSVPVSYAAPREKDGVTVREKIVRTIKRVVCIVLGDAMTEPKPATTTTT